MRSTAGGEVDRASQSQTKTHCYPCPTTQRRRRHQPAVREARGLPRVLTMRQTAAGVRPRSGGGGAPPRLRCWAVGIEAADRSVPGQRTCSSRLRPQHARSAGEAGAVGCVRRQ